MEQETLQLFSSYDETTGHWDTVPSLRGRFWQTSWLWKVDCYCIFLSH